MMALILQEEGKRPKEAPAWPRGLCPQPEEQAHIELHETAPPTRARIQNCSTTYLPPYAPTSSVPTINY